MAISNRTDEAIQTDVLEELKWDAAIPAGKVDVTVSQGWVRLEGEVDHGFQKRDALRAILCGETGGGGDRLLVGARCH